MNDSEINNFGDILEKSFWNSSVAQRNKIRRWNGGEPDSIEPEYEPIDREALREQIRSDILEELREERRIALQTERDAKSADLAYRRGTECLADHGGFVVDADGTIVRSVTEADLLFL